MRAHPEPCPSRTAFPLVALLLLVIVLIPGCNAHSAPAATQSQSDDKIHLSAPRITPEELERLNRAFADRAVMRLSTATDQLLQDNSDLAQCRRIRDIRATAAMSIYDIVTDGDPYLQTLNLTVVISLQHVAWVDEDNAHKIFGDRAAPIISSLNATYADVRVLASNLFSAAQLQTLDSLIAEWRQKNPDIRYLFNAQFTDFINDTELTPAAREKAGGLFNDIAKTRQTVEDTRALAERAFYLSKRMPLLLAWRTETTLDTVAATPQLSQALTDLHTLAGASDRLPSTLEAQRKALLADFDQRQQAVDSSVKNIRETLAQAEALAASAKTLLPELQKTLAMLQDTLKETDAIANRYLASPSTVSSNASTTAPAAPLATFMRNFNIQDYTTALHEASQTARDLNAALVTTQNLLDSPAWHARIAEIDAAADGRVHIVADQSQHLVTSVFMNIYIGLAALLLVFILASFLHARFQKKSRLPNP